MIPNDGSKSSLRVQQLPVTRTQELLAAGMAFIKEKEYERAEETLLAVYQIHSREPRPLRSEGLDSATTILYGLGRVYRLTGRYEDAIEMLEKALPLPAAFSELVSIFRFLAKSAKKEGDAAAYATWYCRMFSLAKIHATVMGLKMHGSIAPIVDWQRAAKWIAEIRNQRGTIYSFPFDGKQVPGDALLNATDWKILKTLLPVASQE